MADSELRRAHPASVVVGAVKLVWQGLGAAVGIITFGTLQEGPYLPLIILGVAILAIASAIGFSLLKWRFFRYGVIGDDLVIAEGWLIKKRRTIPLARAQGIDIRADVLMRLLGLTDVVVQTAGGGSGEPEAKIGQIPLDEAERLRVELLHARQAAQAEASAEDADLTPAGAAVGIDPPQQVIGLDPVGRMSDLRGAFGGAEVTRIEPTFEHKITLPRLLLAAATSKTVLIVSATLIAGASQILGMAGDDIFDRAAGFASTLGLIALVASAFGVLLISLIAGAMATIARDFGFTARRVHARVETESGLLSRRMTSMPVRRIQAIVIEQTAPRRLLGWASVTAITAGFGAGEEQKTETAPALVPIAKDIEIRDLIAGLLPEAATFPALSPVPRRSARFYLLVPVVSTILISATAVVAAFLIYPPVWPFVFVVGLLAIALVFVTRFLEWQHEAFGADDRVLGIQNGAFGRRRVRVGRNRIQSLTVRQNPFQRRAGIATVDAVGVSGSTAAHYRIRHIEQADAEQLMRWYSHRD